VNRLRRGSALAVLLLASGCAQRGVVSGPPSSTGPGTWLVVGIAATAAVLVLAALVVLPAWRRGGSAFAAGLLAIQAGAVLVGSAVLVGAAYQGAQLVTRPRDMEPAVSLIEVSGLDGRDAGFFRLVGALAVVLGILLVIILALAARFAADVDPLERMLACGTLAVEALASAAAAVAIVLGHDSPPFLLVAAALPVLTVAILTCWPHREAEPEQLGYNGGHG
jgi:hypothetical protein